MADILVTHLDPESGNQADNPIFLGSVSIQSVLTEPASRALTVTSVTFCDGARNRPHRHSTDQVLVAILGRGFVAGDGGEQMMEPGDVAFIPAGTRHWHGAQPGTTFSHLSIVTPGHTQIDDV